MERLSVHFIGAIAYRLRAGPVRASHLPGPGPHARRTVRRCRKLAAADKYLDPSGPLLEPAQVFARLESVSSSPPTGKISTAGPYRELAKGMVKQGVETVAIHQRLVRRFVHHVRPSRKQAVVRLESAPGQCAQVEFVGGRRCCGTHCARVVEQLLGLRPLDRLRSVQGLLGLPAPSLRPRCWQRPGRCRQGRPRCPLWHRQRT